MSIYPHTTADRENWPLTLEAAVKRLLADMGAAEREALGNMTAQNLPNLHFTLGVNIRSQFGLWRGNTRLLKSCGSLYPDAASLAIIRAAWQQLQSGSVPAR